MLFNLFGLVNTYINQGTEEDCSEFLPAVLDVLAQELEFNIDGLTLLNKFWGREKFQRKFRSSRYAYLMFDEYVG